MKKILHQKFQKGEFSYETINQWHNWLVQMVDEKLDDSYIVVTTPTDLEVLEDDQAVISIDAKRYTLEKASIYDDLCK